MSTDRDLLHLSHIIEAGEAILEYTASGHGAFQKDRMLRDAVVRNLEIIGEASKRVTEDVKASHGRIPWRRIAGLRDIVAHQYEHIDYEEVWRIVEDDLPGLLVQVQRILDDRKARSLGPGPG